MKWRWTAGNPATKSALGKILMKGEGRECEGRECDVLLVWPAPYWRVEEVE